LNEPEMETDFGLFKLADEPFGHQSRLIGRAMRYCRPVRTRADTAGVVGRNGAMSSSRSGWPAGPEFHPEFGFLCPSPRRRRGIRIAVLSIATTVAIGATMGLAVAHWSDGGGQPSAREFAHPANLPAADVDASPVTPVPATHAPVRLGQQSCNPGAIDLVAFFFNPACESRRFHARHGARATNRVATVILGRKDTAPDPLALTAIEPSQAADKSPNPLTPPPKKRKASPDAPITPVAREPSRQNDLPNGGMVRAYASTPKFGREPFEPYRDKSRSTALQSSFDALFGRLR
jgi:hypothetical protein